MSVHDPNANRPGYKETQVGWIPEEWECLKLDDVSSRVTGHTPDKNIPEYWDGGISWVSLADSDRLDSRELTSTSKEISELGLKKSSARLHPTGTVILLRDASVGRVAVMGSEMAVSQHFVCWICNDNLNNIFLFYWLLGGRKLFQRMAVGTTIVTIGMPFFAKLKIPLPPLPEQKKIAEILSTCDEVIEKTGALIEAKKRQKRALMQQLLTGRKRLPGFAGSGERTEYRFFDLPSDWSCPPVREIAQERSERNGESDDHAVLACSKHLGFVESATYFKKQVFSDDTSNYKVVRRGWFGFPSNHVEEGSIGLLSTHDSGIVSPIYCVFETSSIIIPEYLYAVFKSETFRHIFSVTTNASVDRRGSLRWDAFSSIRVPCPSVAEQTAIAEVNKAASDEIDALARKHAALKQQKRALMQKLLTGQIRVKV